MYYAISFGLLYTYPIVSGIVYLLLISANWKVKAKIGGSAKNKDLALKKKNAIFSHFHQLNKKTIYL